MSWSNVCDVKCIAHSNQTHKEVFPNSAVPQLYGALQPVFAHCFGFQAHKLTVWFTVTTLYHFQNLTFWWQLLDKQTKKKKEKNKRAT